MPKLDDLPRLSRNSPFPDPSAALGMDSGAPGLLALGADLSVERLTQAYRRGIFPWFSAGQPIMWWSPDPRMVLKVNDFRLHRSFRKTLTRFSTSPHEEIRVDSAFRKVMESCASTRRPGQRGTWILAPMVEAYVRLHQAGLAHSVETWRHGELVGGLYCVAIGKAVFGESMFSHVPDASKTALAALVAICKMQGVAMIDCQQNTRHLASLGAREIPRSAFAAHLAKVMDAAPLNWQFQAVYWCALLQTGLDRCDGP